MMYGVCMQTVMIYLSLLLKKSYSTDFATSYRLKNMQISYCGPTAHYIDFSKTNFYKFKKAVLTNFTIVGVVFSLVKDFFT